MLQRFSITFIFLASITLGNGQELFPLTEPASNVPKGIFGFRATQQTYNEFGSQKHLTGVRILYGITSKLTILSTINFSNHHGTHLPLDLIAHSYQGNNLNYYTYNTAKGKTYPYRFAGCHFYTKYRFLSIDKKNEHFRMALFGELSTADQAHDEAEASLMDDSKGFGGGLISTYLKHHFATSLTLGYSKPGTYKEAIQFEGEPLITQTSIQYGQSFNYSLSFGYLLYPKIYKDYNQTNWNIYLEFIGKSYDKAIVIQNEVLLSPQNSTLIGGNYLEIHPGIQAIVRSNLRLEMTAGFNLINRSFTKQYPIYTFSIQRYIY